MQAVMQVNRSGYYRYLMNTASARKEGDLRLQVEIKALFNQSRHSYGSRRISKALKAKGYPVGRYKARSIMQEIGLECKQRRRYTTTTQSKHPLAVAENKLNREFTVNAPNRVWVADITYLWTQEGWLYLAAVLDLFSRRIVGWALAEPMKEGLISEALLMAMANRRPSGELMHHSDRGSQYASLNYQQLLNEHQITVSMSRKGNCWDNAVIERFFGSLKSERTQGKIYLSRLHAKEDVIDYIEHFYNPNRLHSTLNYVSPIQFEMQNTHLFN